ncbi:50S ribosomal protein L25 [Patescibacteria group bacterium]|nr:50S ribosomal protein L25 [Patescibacteria group bacterium]MBU4482242.1 50S ribosomal protein L25 [Patescibacteria group bacterium]
MTKKNINLKAQTRNLTGKAVASLREQGKLPAVLYGNGIENHNLVMEYSDFEKLYNQVTESDLIDLTINDKEKVKILIHDIQRDPVTHKFLHIDFYQVKMDEKIKTEVELEFINESPAVKDLNGSLIKALDHVEIECLPGDLISNIKVDLSTLKTFDDIIRAKDLNAPAEVEIQTDPETTVALVEEPKIEAEPVAEEKKEEEKSEEEKSKEEDNKSEQSSADNSAENKTENKKE